jgi:hypothetical protein
MGEEYLSRSESNGGDNFLDFIHDPRLLYEGSKAFWRYRCTLDIFIINHPALECIEVVAYNPTTDCESSRIYLNALGIAALIPPSELQAHIEKKKEVSLRANKSFRLDAIVKDLTNQFIVNYVLSRINPSNISQTEIVMALTPTYNDVLDEDSGLLKTLLREPPAELQPYSLKKVKTIP